jgi:hypothetical protein
VAENADDAIQLLARSQPPRTITSPDPGATILSRTTLSFLKLLDVDKNQLGTIIVSVSDEPFSLDNPEHKKVANDIEIRLVDQDLLPRFTDL